MRKTGFKNLVFRNIGTFIVTALLGRVFLSVFLPLPAQAIISDGANAIDAVGQYTDATFCTTQNPSYTKGGLNNLPNPYGLSPGSGYGDSMAIDSVNHRLFISDGNNARILVFNLSVGNLLADRVPDFVLGQPDFSSKTLATTQAGMQGTTGLAYDAVNNRLFASDISNARVLVYDVASITNGENAVNVLGQANFTSNASALTQAGMMDPGGLAYDATGSRLFVTDIDQNRVLVYDVASITNGENAVNVLGQSGYTTSTAATSQAGVNRPIGLAYDGAGSRLFVLENNNNRVKVYDVASITNGESAVNVLGQSGYTTSTAATSQAGMNNPQGIAYDSANSRLFVSQSQAERITVYDVASITNGESAVNVLGQANFTSETSATTQAGMYIPTGLAYEGTTSRLFLLDSLNYRVTVFDVASITDGENAVDLIGQYTDATFCSTQDPSYVKGAANNFPNKYGLVPGGTAIDTTGHRLFVADGYNNRILVFNLNASNQVVDKTPDFVLGQADFSSSTAATTQAGTSVPWALAYDSAGSRLFVAEEGNNRVAVYDVASITNGENAVNVLGQANFTTGTATTSQSRMNIPHGIAYDASGSRLFVSQVNANRVTVYDVASITNGENAVAVLGQSTYTASTAATTQAGMNTPQGIAYDSTNSRLFVTQSNAARVTVYDVASITNGENAVAVLGQSSYTSGSTATTQAGMNVPMAAAYDSANSRLFVADSSNHRVTVYDVASITNGENAVNALGQANFTSGAAATTQAGMNSPFGVTYDATNNRLLVSDNGNSRITVYDASLTPGPQNPTLSNKIALSRLKAGVSGAVDITFTLQDTLSGTLTVTFPAGFTVTAAATGGASSGCLSSFGFTAQTLTATKSSCSGTITLGGATVTNPSTPGAYYISWVNDDPGGGTVYIVSEDQIGVTSSVDPFLTFNAGSQAAATACDGTFSGSGGTVALGTLSTGSVTSSDASSVTHLCTRISTNASSGAAVSVKSANAGLKSTSVPADVISSATATLAAGTAGYGLCAGSAGGDSGRDTTTPAGATPSRSSPFNGASCTSSGHDVGALTTSAQNIWTITGASQNAFARLYVKAAIGATTIAHNDYTDTLTFVGTGTY
jgi:DNA-binding beta-propeller fold protein YncE